jgi:iron complex outermembrane receptor protein
MWAWRRLAAVLCLVMPGLPLGAQEPAEPVSLEIEAQPLGDALKTLAEQADLQLVFLPGDIGERRSPELKARVTVNEALTRLLAGTPLEFVRTAEGVYIVRERTPGSMDAKTPPAVPPDDKPRPRRDPRETAPKELVAETAQPSSLGDLMVTGTHLRGSPAGAQVISIDREDFERMGFSTLQDVIRTLPQNFGGGATEDTTRGLEAQTNTGKGNALNLRGLGSSSTLVLLNGRRLALGGNEAAFTDVSNIPLTAVERIDVLPDGASAFYGSDAVGGVVNIVLRDDYVGAESQVRASTVTDGQQSEWQGGQVIGGRWQSGNALVALEYYRRDPLLAKYRAQAASDLRPFGGDNFDVRTSNPGTIVIGAQTWAIPAGQDGTALTPADFVAGTQNLTGRKEGADLLPRQQRASVVATVHQQVTDRLDLFLDALVSRREFESRSVGAPVNLVVTPANPFYVNPTGGSGPVVVAYNFLEDLGRLAAFGTVEVSNAAFGAAWQAGNDWRITGYGAYAREEQEQRQRNLVNFGELLQALNDPDPATALNPFGDGSNTNPATLARIRTNSVLGVDSTLRSAHLLADGPLLDLGAGEIKLAVGADHRRQLLDSSNVSQVNVGGTNIQHHSERSVSSAFGEVMVPLVSTKNAAPAIRRLQLSLAGRVETYSDFGGTEVPAAGLVWEPLEGVAVRGTWSRSFKAPSLAQLDESQNALQIAPLPDTSSATGFTQTLIWFGKSADLNEETATSWTLGAEIAPPAVAQLRFGLTYFDIEFQDRIQMSSFNFANLADPLSADLVDRTPTAEERARVCARGNFFGNPADCTAAPVGAIADVRIQNIALSRTRGFDFVGAWAGVTSMGDLEARLSGTYLVDFGQAARASLPVVELVDTQNNPLDLRLRGSLTWQRGSYEASLFLNYADSYRDTFSNPDRRVDSWTTYDVQLAWQARERDGPLDGLRVSLSVQNLLDDDPPFLNNANGIGYDEENADLLGRIVRFHVRKSW